jgi:hypothetical protein
MFELQGMILILSLRFIAWSSLFVCIAMYNEHGYTEVLERNINAEKSSG